MLKKFGYLLKTMRPRQWPKNIFVLAALVFDQQLFNLASLGRTLAAFALFCLVSSLIYIINDLADIESDRRHPDKCHRPLAAGLLPKHWAVTAAVILAVTTLPVSFLLSIGFGLVISGYFLLMLAYSFWLKNIALLDVLIIAIGFVLRVASGLTVITTNQFSPWLFLATTFLALFIALGKRRSEIALLEQSAGKARKVLEGYSLALIDQMLIVVISSTLMTYCLYTFSSTATSGNFGMMLTIPFVIYALFRYLYLLNTGHLGGAPEEVILTDHPFQLVVALWGLTVILLLYVFNAGV
ncbi:MAG: decaprenyl-phosphate phosphoribosyltransferase [Anaerolineaceae bacterium]|nr:decaprenyl-phosphate phosphoribosyltransferase [Anaerolineaceae bacterium]